MVKKNLLVFIFFIFHLSFSQTSEELLKITKKYDKELLGDLAIKFKKQYLLDKEIALKQASIYNWPTKIKDGNRIIELQKIINGYPIYYTSYNLNAAKSTRAYNLHSGNSMDLNIEGQNMRVHIWDGSLARSTHNEFMVNGASKITNGDGSTQVGYHATHVSGTVGAIGINSNAKGMAPAVNITSYDWNNDLSEMVTAASNGMLISNHSYGATASNVPDWAFGAYISDSKLLDEIMYNAPHYLVVLAAGNEGRTVNYNSTPLENNSLFDQLSFYECSKNSLVVGAADDLGVNSNGDIIANYQVANFSNAGPTDDYRIKPDILGNGIGVFSSTDGSNGTYASENGTSMASPSVAGSLILLQQLYNQEKGIYALASTIKGLALHHADDGGLIGPDATYGWGYLNTKKAAEHILNNDFVLEEKTLNNNETISYTVHSVGQGKTLKASISWTDPASNNVNNGFLNLNNPVLVNDLDIRVTKNGTTYFPWRLSSVDTNEKADNLVDPFELVEIPYSNGTYTVTITHKGTLINDHQDFTLLVSEINSNSVSVGSNELSSALIWPNPTNDILNIHLTTTIDKIDISLFDVFGKRIFTSHFRDENYSIDTSKLDPGVYFLTLKNKNKKYTKKIIIN